MNTQHVKHELQNLISGESGASYDAIIQAVLSHLRGGESASSMAQGKLEDKAQEAKKLIRFARAHNLVLENIPEERFIANGAEQRVYIVEDNYVVKLNDAIYYACWRDYFNNLLLHNYFFADTAYILRGFYVSKSKIYAVVEQQYIRADSMTDLDEVRAFMLANGFVNNRRHDYKHEKLGLILEDLHDENVLTADGVLHFIDTVFFITSSKFWS